MKTIFLLMAEFETPNIPLKEICKKYFDLSIDQAVRDAKQHKLPVPAFQMGKQRSDWFVSIDDLAAFIDEKAEEARKVHKKMKAA